MSAKNDQNDERHFAVTSIEKTEPPADETDGNWYQYTIGEGDSAITGIRAGSRASVRKHAEEFAENLNRRAALGYSTYTARRVQK